MCNVSKSYPAFRFDAQRWCRNILPTQIQQASKKTAEKRFGTEKKLTFPLTNYETIVVDVAAADQLWGPQRREPERASAVEGRRRPQPGRTFHHQHSRRRKQGSASSELQKYIQNVSWLSVKDPRGGRDGTFGGKVDPGTVLYRLMSRAASFKGVVVHVGWKNRRFK